MNRPFLLSCLALGALFVACDSSGTGPSTDDQIASVAVSPPSAYVEIGQTVQLSAQAVNNEGALLTAQFTWSSSDESVATISQAGLVTGVAPGAATITATAQGVPGSASVLVVDLSEPNPPSNVAASAVSNTEVDVSWSDNSDNEDEFRIDREVVLAGAYGPEVGPQKVYAEVGIVGPNVTYFSDAGLLSGTSYRYRVRACNENGCSDPGANEGEVTTYQALVIQTTTLPHGSIGQAYEQALSASGANASATWSVSEGTLPDGITLSGAGVLSGTPTSAGTYTFTVQVDWGGQTATQELTLEIQAVLTVLTTSLPNGVVGSSYENTLEASGGDGTYAWSVIVGSLPDGLTLALNGAFSGIPTSTGTFPFTVQVTSAGETLVADFSIRVFNPVVITTGPLPNGRVGDAYSVDLNASGGNGFFDWSIVAGALPTGLTMDPMTGLVSGSPTTEGLFTFTVQATSAGMTGSKEYTITVNPALSITTTVLPNARVGIIYNFFLDADGGDGNFTWALVGGVVPPGLSLHVNGVITGTPSLAGTFPFTVQVSSAGLTATANLTLGVYEFLSVTTTSLPEGQFGQAYSATLSATGGDGVYTWDISAGALPQGLSLSSDGVISGTPQVRGTFNFSVRVQSGDGQATFKALSITIPVP
ncbi:MAG: putative Ig domain-containing protein [Gemmatimonadota bacterium]|jgi:hypothetical protein